MSKRVDFDKTYRNIHRCGAAVFWSAWQLSKHVGGNQESGRNHSSWSRGHDNHRWDQGKQGSYRYRRSRENLRGPGPRFDPHPGGLANFVRPHPSGAAGPDRAMLRELLADRESAFQVTQPIGYLLKPLQVIES